MKVLLLPFTNLQRTKNEVTIDSDVINLQNNIFYLFNLQQLEQASILIEKVTLKILLILLIQ